jgi:hypothetical protein
MIRHCVDGNEVDDKQETNELLNKYIFFVLKITTDSAKNEQSQNLSIEDAQCHIQYVVYVARRERANQVL